MKSPLFSSALVGITLAILCYFLQPLLIDAVNTNLLLALGVIIGSIGCIAVIAASGSIQIDAVGGNTQQSLTTLYVGNLPYRANEQAVQQHFQNYADVSSVRLMKDKRTGKRKGYGFVEIKTNNADSIISELNDSDFQDRTLKVRLAKEKSKE